MASLSNITNQIKQEAKEYFKEASGCHDWTHVERVLNLALRIGNAEKANLEVIQIATYLHDIGRKEEIKSGGDFCHAEKGAELASELLRKYNIAESTISNVVHCIICHRFRNNNIPETIEAKVLFDADKLDSIGAIGIARGFLFAGNAGSGNLYTRNEKELAKMSKDHSFTKEDSAILEYEIKLRYIKNKIITNTGKKIAENRHTYMVEYFDRFWKEAEGEL